MSPPEAEDWIRPISTEDLQRQMDQQRLTIEQRRAAEQQGRQLIEQQMLLASEQQRRYEQQQWRDAYEQQPIGPVQAEYARQLEQEAQRQAQRQYELEARQQAYERRQAQQQAYERGPVNYGQFIYAQPLTEGSLPPPFSDLGRSSLERLGMSPSPPPPTPTKDDPLGQGAGPLLLPDQQPVSDLLLEYIERVAENKGRVKATKIADGLTPDERRKEQARQKIAKALNEGVAAGYLTEARAVSMIAAGGLNDRPMQPEGALDQVVACLAQSVLAGALDRATADTIVAMIGRAGRAQGEARPVSQPPERVGSLLEQIERRDDLIYAALIIRPCHLIEHAELHRTSVWVCDAQAALAWSTMLEGLEIDAVLLPRAAHMLNGDRALCCRSDGNVGTWLRWGKTVGPVYEPEPVEESA